MILTVINTQILSVRPSVRPRPIPTPTPIPTQSCPEPATFMAFSSSAWQNILSRLTKFSASSSRLVMLISDSGIGKMVARYSTYLTTTLEAGFIRKSSGGQVIPDPENPVVQRKSGSRVGIIECRRGHRTPSTPCWSSCHRT